MAIESILTDRIDGIVWVNHFGGLEKGIFLSGFYRWERRDLCWGRSLLDFPESQTRRKNLNMCWNYVAIDNLRGDQSIQAPVNRLWREGKAAFSVLSVYELSAGIRDKEEKGMMDFLATCRLVEVSIEVSLKGGGLYRNYRSKGITLSAVDCLIAATAIVHGMKVATRNTKHYPEEGILLRI